MANRSVTTRRVLVLSVILGMPFAIFAGCSTSNPPATNGAGGRQTNESCATAGQTRECHQLLSSQGGVRTCMVGTQTCTPDGRWSACVPKGDGLLESTIAPDIDPANAHSLRPRALSAASVDASACSNACNPDCVGYDEDAGPTSLDASLKFDALVPFPGTNPGFEDKLLQDDCAGHTYTGPCENWDTADPNTASVASACQADTYCEHRAGDSGTGCCTRYQAGETHASVSGKGAVTCKSSAPDLTVSGACILQGKVVLPVCNRGSAAVPAGTTINGAVEAPAGTLPYETTSSCYGGSGTDCSITLAADLNPGDCLQMIEGTHCANLNGNKLVYINSGTTPITECALDVKDSISTAGDQLGCSNNFTAFNSAALSTCPTLGDPKVLTQQYENTCPPGSRPQWSSLAWRASTPTGARIIFEVRSRPKLADGGFGAWTAFAQIGDVRLPSPPNDPQDCRMDGTVAGCPKSISTALGAAAALNEQLEVQVTLSSTTFQFPVLYGWYVNYSCVDVE